MRTVTIVLGGASWTVARLPALRAIAWRKGAEGLLEELPALAKLYDTETQSQADLVAAALVMYREAGAVVERIIESVLTASDELVLRRDEILETATEEELLAAFQTLLLLNAPLAGLASGMAAAAPAEEAAATNGGTPLPIR